VQPLTDAFATHGGAIVANLALVPNQVSYRSEVLQAFAAKPQCAFVQVNQQTTSTLFSNMRQLGDLTIPFIGTSNYNDLTEWKAGGFAAGSTQLTGDIGASSTGPAADYFNALYSAAYSKESTDPTPTYFASGFYDGVLVFALAMTAANSTDPKVWLKDVIKVSSPPGTMCYTFSSCVVLLKQGKKINYEGASGNMDFDQHHNTYTPFNIVTFDAQGALQIVITVPPAEAAQY